VSFHLRFCFFEQHRRNLLSFPSNVDVGIISNSMKTVGQTSLLVLIIIVPLVWGDCCIGHAGVICDPAQTYDDTFFQHMYCSEWLGPICIQCSWTLSTNSIIIIVVVGVALLASFVICCFICLWRRRTRALVINTGETVPFVIPIEE